ncbi:hypothetical protein [uncultured Methanobrevibacter sp.]|uniref:hypothetical protein n=1 Tax=uncultured Methanobrevibacter sp. TaxID=253161 RepID=UPI0025D2F1B1|nr:hypothetical protein [uncultured Methanobrevibacter sp.]
MYCAFVEQVDVSVVFYYQVCVVANFCYVFSFFECEVVLVKFADHVGSNAVLV